MTKSIDQYFCDWEAHVFGFGFGTGEAHIIPALKQFMDIVPEAGPYDHRILERELTPTVAWLLINILCRCDILDYGSSPRTAWLDGTGEELRAYIRSRTVEELYGALEKPDGYTHCDPYQCACPGEICDNPFWESRESAASGGF